jgi:hypothetical protein
VRTYAEVHAPFDRPAIVTQTTTTNISNKAVMSGVHSAV